VLIPSSSPGAAEDWTADSGGDGSISYKEFYSSIFELVDVWCETMEARDYASCLNRLLWACTDGRGATRMIRDTVEPIDESEPEPPMPELPEDEPEAPEEMIHTLAVGGAMVESELERPLPPGLVGEEPGHPAAGRNKDGDDDDAADDSKSNQKPPAPKKDDSRPKPKPPPATPSEPPPQIEGRGDAGDSTMRAEPVLIRSTSKDSKTSKKSEPRERVVVEKEKKEKIVVARGDKWERKVAEGGGRQTRIGEDNENNEKRVGGKLLPSRFPLCPHRPWHPRVASVLHRPGTLT